MKADDDTYVIMENMHNMLGRLAHMFIFRHTRVSDPDPVFKFLCIRIRFRPPEKKECRKDSKSYLLEENLKIITKDRQKN